MNKRGFTLIELLIIIGLLALMGGFFSVNMTRILNRTNSSNEAEAYTELIAAADVYLAMNKEETLPLYNGESSIIIKVKDLKSAELISKDYAVNGKAVKDNAYVTVKLGSQGEFVFRIEMSDN